ncbi:hypothetical protein [Breoghania sp. JC706]|uniref:hypothetical protein n=1 Tax=Breoghania sp. JC706 TaxID=3117732 RepID=UPI0030089690
MSSRIGDLLEAYRDLVRSRTSLPDAPEPEADVPVDEAGSPALGDMADLAALMDLAERLLRSPPGGHGRLSGGGAGLVPGLREPAGTAPFAAMRMAVESPGLTGEAASETRFPSPGAAGDVPAVPDEAEPLERFFRLLDVSDEGGLADLDRIGDPDAGGDAGGAWSDGGLSMVILNAAMIPGWPGIAATATFREKAAAGLVRKFAGDGSFSDEEIGAYLAGLGLDPDVVEKLRRQVASLDARGRKVAMWLACLISLLGRIVSTLRRELEDMTPGLSEDPATRSSRDRLYLD